MKKDLIYISLIVILATLSGFMYFDNISNAKQFQSNLNASFSEVEFYKNSLDQEVSKKRALIIDKDQLKETIKNLSKDNLQLQNSIKKYRKINSVLEQKMTIKIDTIFVPFDNVIECEFEREIDLKNSLYLFKAKVNNLGFKILELELQNTQTIVIGNKKNGWFKSDELTVEVTNSNELIKTVEVEVIVTKKKKKLIENQWFTGLIGFVAGVLLSN